jgi:tripeptide aminopeptidase
VASAIVDAMPADHLPETTDGRQPYLHAYAVTGTVGQAEVHLLVRAFSTSELEARERVLRDVVEGVGARFPGATLAVDIKPSYRNMREHMIREPKVVDHADEAVRRQGLEPVRRAIRGGTDGAKLSARGLLTPNLFAGGQSPHSVREWASLEWMAAAVGVCIQLLEV